MTGLPYIIVSGVSMASYVTGYFIGQWQERKFIRKFGLKGVTGVTNVENVDHTYINGARIAMKHVEKPTAPPPKPAPMYEVWTVCSRCHNALVRAKMEDIRVDEHGYSLKPCPECEAQGAAA